MILKGPLGKDQEIIDVSTDEVQILHQFGHLLLEDIGTIAESHWQALHLVFPKWEDKGA